MFAVDKSPSGNVKSPQKSPKAKFAMQAKNSPKAGKMGKSQQFLNKEQNGQSKPFLKRKFDGRNKSKPGFKKQFEYEVSDTIVAKNISVDIREKDVKTFFSQYGQVEEVENMTKLYVGQHKPVYKIKFSSVDEASKALKGRELLNGRPVFRLPMNFKAAGPGNPAFSVHISNLPEYNNEEVVKQFFASCGKIRRVNLRPMRTGFVNFFDEESCKKAIRLNNTEFNGKKIGVEPISSESNKQNKKKQTQLKKKAPVKNEEKDENEGEESDDEDEMKVQEEQDDDDDDDDDDDEDDDEEENEEEEDDDDDDKDDDDDDDDEEEEDEDEEDSDDDEEDEDDEPANKKTKQNPKMSPIGKNIQKKTSVMMKIQKPKVKGKGGKS